MEALLTYYDCEDSFETIKDWYDGYQFGMVDVYCPWDVMNYVDALRVNPAPKDYWSNTSSNDMVRRFIQKAKTTTTKREIEQLIAGGGGAGWRYFLFKDSKFGNTKDFYETDLYLVSGDCTGGWQYDGCFL